MHKTSRLSLITVTKQKPIYNISIIQVRNKAEASKYPFPYILFVSVCGFLYFSTIEK